MVYVYEFSGFELDTDLCALRRGGRAVSLRPKAYRLLLYLLKNRHRVVSKEMLYEAVWPRRIVSDATLESTILAIRHALGDTSLPHQFIQTRHGHGYRFIAEVTERLPGYSAADGHEILPPPR